MYIHLLPLPLPSSVYVEEGSGETWYSQLEVYLKVSGLREDLATSLLVYFIIVLAV